MKKCNACGTMNTDENLYCENCGASISEAPVVDSKKVLPLNKKYLKIGGAVVAVILVIFMGSQILFANSPTVQVLSGLMKSMMNDESEGHLELSFESSDPMMDDFLEEIIFAFDYEVNKTDIATKTELSIQDESALEAVFALQDSIIYVDLLDLYDEKFYYSDKTIENYTVQAEQLRGYLKDVSIKGVDYKKYVKAIESELGKNLYKKGGRVHLELDEENLLDVMEVVFEEAEDDEKLVEVLHKELTEVLSKMADDDFEFNGLDGDDWETALEEIEDFDDFEDNYEIAISDILDSIQWEKEDDYRTSFDLNVSFDFGMFNTIKAMNIEFDMDELMAVNASYKNDSKYNFKKFKEESGVDIEDLMSDYDEMSDVSRDVIENLSEKIQANETLIKYIESSDYYKDMEAWYGFDGTEEFFEILLDNFL